MTAVAVETTQLEFAHGDRDIDLYHIEPDQSVYWYWGSDALARAEFHDDTIKFVRLNRRGSDAYNPEEFERTHSSQICKLLGERALVTSVFDKDKSKWKTASYTVPSLSFLNKLNQEAFQPIGAHQQEVIAMKGDGIDGVFEARTMVEAFSDGVMPVSGSAPSYIHDTVWHGAGITALEAETFGVLKELCGFALSLEQSKPGQANILQNKLVKAYDLATFYYSTTPDEKEGCPQLAAGRTDELFTELFRLLKVAKASPRTMSTVLKIVEKGPFTYNVSKKKVIRYRRVAEYYTRLNALIEDL